MRKMIYLACPYTHPDLSVREHRFDLSARAAAYLIAQGNIVYSPITMTHPIDRHLADGEGTLGSDFWVDFDEAFMEHCSELILLKIEGWQKSSGVRREIEYFLARDLPVSAIEVFSDGFKAVEMSESEKAE